MDIKALQKQLAVFASERDWQQFHSPKNLSMALAAESGELLEIFQWITESQSQALDPKRREQAALELADIALYVLRLADVLDINLEHAITHKLKINAKKYPVDLAKGNATKYNQRD
ncbi:MAG: nucleotide pyrophosphohydrolase [Gammaproteobacteria bacterium]|nr:nucleotide pyrophosphohydrolase [Gammaproteobacteria bacterium]